MTLKVASILNGTDVDVLAVESDGSIVRRGLRLADLQAEIAAVRIDSRTVSRNDLFVALPGSRAHGNEYVASAFGSGARAALVPALPDSGFLPPAPAAAPGEPRYVFVADDPLVALQQLATYWRRRNSARIVGITGSIGKTTTKELVAAVLSTAMPVLKNEANLNTEIGLPLTVLGLETAHRVAVLEMGMYERGDISTLCAIAEPDVGIVTNVSTNHLERMGTIEAIAREKSRLVASLPPGGVAILNADDRWTRAMALASGTAPAVLAGTHSDADFRAEDVQVHGLDGMSFVLCAEGMRASIRTQVPGSHTIHAFLFAAAVARWFDMAWQDVCDALQSVRVDARQRILREGDDLLIIDDSYNAAPMSMYAALALLQASPGTKVAVLGDMLELGPVEEAAHRDVGKQAAQVADWLVVRGERGAWLADAARAQGLPANRVIQTQSNAEAVQVVRGIVNGSRPAGTARADWSILVKGSRGMRLEEVVAGLRAKQT